MKRRRRIFKILLIITAVAVIAVIILSQRPMGDTDIRYEKAYSAFPNRMAEWDQSDSDTRALLERFKPRLLIAPGSYVPMNFYKDYLQRCDLVSARKGVLKHAPDRADLVKYRLDPDKYLDYMPLPDEALALAEKDVSPTLYGRIYQDALETDERSIPLIFLKYSPVYPYSGLPAKISLLKRIGSSIMADRIAWHELDIHGAIHVVLHGQTRKPLGIILAQHHHHRVFLAGRDFTWPDDDRVTISVSWMSNEPYLPPEQGEFKMERVTGNPMHIDFLFGRTDKEPLEGGYDRVYSKKGGAREVETELELILTDDPLYTSWMPLGARHRILGLIESWYTKGPPGMDFYTFPDLKNMADLMAFWFVDQNDGVFFDLVKKNIRSFEDREVEPVLLHQKTRLVNELVKNGN